MEETENTLLGLQNFGNMCFLNVVVQSLWNLSSVKNFFFKIHVHDHEEYTRMNSFQEILTFLENVKVTEKDIVLTDKTYSENEVTYVLNELKQKNSSKVKIQGLNPEYYDKIIVSKDSSNCLLCLMINFFTYYKYSSKKSLSTNNLRKILTKLNDYINKFDESGMCCSSEALEEMLNYFHRSNVFYDYLKFKNEVRFKLENLIDVLPCTNKCLTHAVFVTKYKELLYCETCQEVSDLKQEDKAKVECFVFYIYSAEFLKSIEESRKLKKEISIKSLLRTAPFKNLGLLYSNVCFTCKKNNNLRLIRMITDPPKVLTLNLNKTTDFDKNKYNYNIIYNRIDQEIKLSNIFEFNSLRNINYLLRGFACFRKNHYIYVGYIIHTSCWTLCNDEIIENLGTWETARDYLIKNQWFPCLIFYEDSLIVENELLTKNSKDAGESLSDNDRSLNTSIDRGYVDTSPMRNTLDKSSLIRPKGSSRANHLLFTKGQELPKHTEEKLNNIFDDSRNDSINNSSLLLSPASSPRRKEKNEFSFQNLSANSKTTEDKKLGDNAVGEKGILKKLTTNIDKEIIDTTNNTDKVNKTESIDKNNQSRGELEAKIEKSEMCFGMCIIY